MFNRKDALKAWNQSIGKVANRQAWSAGLLILSSAALGGIAVALWNRQALAKMRVDTDGGGESSASPSRPAESGDE